MGNLWFGFLFFVLVSVKAQNLRERTNTRANYAHDDEDLIRLVRHKFLHSPSTKNYDFRHSGWLEHKSLQSKTFDTFCSETGALNKILNNLSPGFFVEVGGVNGVLRSDTLVLERQLGWKGLLIQPHPAAFRYVQKIRRKAWTANVCLSSDVYGRKINLYVSNQLGNEARIQLKSSPFEPIKSVPTQCFPLSTLLLALNQTTVDYFALDGNDNEVAILETIPFDRFTFKILNITRNGLPIRETQFMNLMEEKGFILFSSLVKPRNDENACSTDSIFLHRSIPVP